MWELQRFHPHSYGRAPPPQTEGWEKRIATAQYMYFGANVFFGAISLRNVGPCRNTVRVDSEGNWVPFIKVNRLFAYCCTVLATPKRYLLLLDEISNSVYCMLGENSKHKWERLQKWSTKQNHVKQIKSYSYVLQELWVVLPGFLLIFTWPRDKGH